VTKWSFGACVINSNYSSVYNLNYFETRTTSAETFVPGKSANFRLELLWVLATRRFWFTNSPDPPSSPFGCWNTTVRKRPEIPAKFFSHRYTCLPFAHMFTFRKHVFFSHTCLPFVNMFTLHCTHYVIYHGCTAHITS